MQKSDSHRYRSEVKSVNTLVNIFFLYILQDQISLIHSVCPQGNPGSDGPPGRDGASGVKVRKQTNSYNILLLSSGLFESKNIPALSDNLNSIQVNNILLFVTYTEVQKSETSSEIFFFVLLFWNYFSVLIILYYQNNYNGKKILNFRMTYIIWLFGYVKYFSFFLHNFCLKFWTKMLVSPCTWISNQL